MHAIELKSGSTVASDFFDAFATLRHQLDGKSPPLMGKWLVYGGERAEQRPQARVLPWAQIGELGAALTSPPPAG